MCMASSCSQVNIALQSQANLLNNTGLKCSYVNWINRVKPLVRFDIKTGMQSDFMLNLNISKNEISKHKTCECLHHTS